MWVFNPKGWTRQQILGDAADLPKYSEKTDEEILPKIRGYPKNSTDTVEVENLPQNFENFRLYGNFIDQALEEGWECTGIDGKWCRKPFLNR